MRGRAPRNPAAYEAGARHGRLTLLNRLPQGKAHVVCECGTEKVVYMGNLISGMTRSCGCLLVEAAVTRCRTHGGSNTALYRIWSGIKRRCLSPSEPAYRYYGARGIAVCAQWCGPGGFERFVADMGERPSPKHSIDRINNDGNYEPGNCRWATSKDQARNTRRNVWLEHGGRRMTASEWAADLGVSRQAIEQRIRWGWSAEKICTTPVSKAGTMLRGRVPGTRLIAFNGIRDTLAGWERRTGVQAGVIHQRLKAGRSLSEAMSTERLPRRGAARAFGPRYDHPRPRRKPSRQYRCSACGGCGHNKATCEHQLNTEAA